MKKKAASGIMLTLLISMLTLAFKVQFAKAEPRTWYVDDSGGKDFTNIWAATVAASPGDTIYVYNGTYYEHITIYYKSLTLIGENKYGVIIDGYGYGSAVRISYAHGVKLARFTVRNAETGIYLYRSYNNTIVSNIVASSTLGGPYWGGGIYLDYSYNNTVADNTISNTTEVGIWLNSYKNIVVNNTISGAVEPVPSSCGGIHLEDGSHDNIIRGNIISQRAYGIYLAFWSDTNNIVGNTILNLSYNVPYGINCWSPNNEIIGNTITNVYYTGIRLNSPGGYPNHCKSNVVSGNVVSHTSQGIATGFVASSNTVTGNNVSHNDIGLFIFDLSDNNTFINNDISNNYYGIVLFSSSGTEVYHNNFIDNAQQVLLSDSSNTVWDNGYPSGGNYWSNYADVDLYNGPNQDLFGMDGIWDHPYVIDAENQDRYPLVKPWPTIPATIDVDPDTLNLRSKGQWITAYIQLPEGYNPEDIDATTILLNETIQPVLDSRYDFVTNSSEYLGDHNNDGIFERMVKFDRASVESLIYSQGFPLGEVALTITGELLDGTPFEGTYIIFAFYGGAGGRRK